MDEQSYIRQANFLRDLQRLLDKHNVEIEVIDKYDGATIDINFLAGIDHATGEPISQYFIHNIGDYLWPGQMDAESNAPDNREPQS